MQSWSLRPFWKKIVGPSLRRVEVAIYPDWRAKAELCGKRMKKVDLNPVVVHNLALRDAKESGEGASQPT